MVADFTPEKERARMIARMRRDGEEEEDLAPAEARKRMIARIRGDDWEESEHPRAKDGKFTSGRGESKTSEAESNTNTSSEPSNSNENEGENEASGGESEGGEEYKGRSRKGQCTWSLKVNGPSKTRAFIARDKRLHPETVKEARRYKKVLSSIKNFQENNPNADDGTYNALTGKLVNFDTGYSVTFHQNQSLEDPYAGYTDDEYAYMCAVAARELRSECYIGYFGNAEVSFHCNDVGEAKKFAVEHNQDSIWDCKKGKTWINRKRNKKTNPVERDIME